MSIYIDPKNQTLLWNLIHKNPMISTVFPVHLQSSKNNWFKKRIEEIYSTLPPTISTEVLFQKNKETLAILINDLSEPLYSRNKPNVSINDQYEERQKEYEEMTKKPVVEEISFKEEKNDGVIKNMDELIQQQLREREQDLQRISKTYNHELKELKESKDELLSVINVPIEKKTVKWGTDNIIDYNFILETKIDELNQKYDHLLEYIERRIPNFIKDLDERKEIKELLSEKIEIIEKGVK